MYLRVYNMDRTTTGSCKAVHVNGVEVHDDSRVMLPRDLYMYTKRRDEEAT